MVGVMWYYPRGFFWLYEEKFAGESWRVESASGDEGGFARIYVCCSVARSGSNVSFLSYHRRGRDRKAGTESLQGKAMHDLHPRIPKSTLKAEDSKRVKS
jgi:hypothetical protein